MSGGPDDPGKPTQKPPPTPPRHDRTGGALTGGLVAQQTWVTGRLKEKAAERKADLQRLDRTKPDSEPTRPQEPPERRKPRPELAPTAPPNGPQEPPERRKLRTFEDRHRDTQTRADMKREQSGAAGPQREAADGRQPELQNGQGSRKPDHYKELKTFEQRHPGIDNDRPR